MRNRWPHVAKTTAVLGVLALAFLVVDGAVSRGLLPPYRDLLLTQVAGAGATEPVDAAAKAEPNGLATFASTSEAAAAPLALATAPPRTGRQEVEVSDPRTAATVAPAGTHLDESHDATPPSTPRDQARFDLRRALLKGRALDVGGLELPPLHVTLSAEALLRLLREARGLLILEHGQIVERVLVSGAGDDVRLTPVVLSADGVQGVGPLVIPIEPTSIDPSLRSALTSELIRLLDGLKTPRPGRHARPGPELSFRPDRELVQYMTRKLRGIVSVIEEAPDDSATDAGGPVTFVAADLTWVSETGGPGHPGLLVREVERSGRRVAYQDPEAVLSKL